MITRGVRYVLSVAGLMASFALAAPGLRAGGVEDGWRCANTPDKPLVAINYCVRAIYSGDLTWQSQQAFQDWTQSESFRKGHAAAGGSRGVITGHPQFEGYEVVL